MAPVTFAPDMACGWPEKLGRLIDHHRGSGKTREMVMMCQTANCMADPQLLEVSEDAWVVLNHDPEVPDFPELHMGHPVHGTVHNIKNTWLKLDGKIGP